MRFSSILTSVVFLLFCAVSALDENMADVQMLLFREQDVQQLIDESMVHVEERLLAALDSEFHVPPCDQDKFILAGQHFRKTLGVPKLAGCGRLFRAIGARIVADGFKGQQFFASASSALFKELGTNVNCFHPINLRKMGVSYRAILPVILVAVEMAYSASNVGELAGNYSCAVQASMDKYRDEIGLITWAFFKGLHHKKRDPCVAVVRFVMSLKGLFSYACGKQIGDYVYGMESSALKILFPQCRLAEPKNMSFADNVVIAAAQF